MDEERVYKKLLEHDKNFLEINRKFVGVDKKIVSIEKRFADIDKKFAKIDKRLDDHDKKFDRVFAKLIEHDDRFDQLELRIEKRISDSENRILSAIDAFMKKTIDVEIEQLSMKSAIGRHEKDITKIKKVVKIA